MGGRERRAVAQVARHTATAFHIDCAFVSQLASGVEAGPLRDGQGFAALNFKVFLQLHRSVHGAFRAVKYDASA